MLNSLQQPQVSKILEAEIVKEVNERINSIEQERWTTRTYLEYGRAVGEATCNYDFLGHVQMPEDFKKYLKSIAPNLNGFPLREIAINRYNVGDFIGPHRDADLYIYNLVVALQENGDGLLINDENRFIEDKIGQGAMFTGIGPIHSVPPVRSLRHCLIYLYG